MTINDPLLILLDGQRGWIREGEIYFDVPFLKNVSLLANSER